MKAPGRPVLVERWRLVVMVGVLLLAAGLRFYQLEVQSFWNDEGNSARLSERSIGLILTGTASDIHPPLYYLALRGWRELAGESEFGLRAFSAYVGIGLVGATFALGRRLLPWLPAGLAALLAAINPALIYYSQEARMYELLALLATLATWLLLRWLAAPTGPPGRWAAVGYVLCLTAGLYTHYFFPTVLAVQAILLGLAVFLPWPGWQVGRRRLAGWLALVAAAVALYLPWLPVFLRQVGGRPETQRPALDFAVEGGRWLAFGGTVEAAAVFWPLLALAVLLGLGLLPAGKGRGGWRAAAGLATMVVLPLLLMVVAGTAREPYYKFMLLAAPPLGLLAARGWWLGWSGAWPGGRGGRWLRRAAVTGLVGVVAWGSGRSLANLYFDAAYARADYRGMAAQIAADGHPNAGIILNAANQWEVFTYYHRDGAPVYPIPRGQPDAADIETELAAIVARHDRLYAIFWGEAERDPQRLVERWLDGHAFKAREEWVGDVRFVTYAMPQGPAGEMETAVDLRFGEDILLLGYTLATETVRPGEIVTLTLFWQTERPLATRYKVFLHLVDEAGQIVAQRDSEPGGGLALTTTWTPGQIVVDNHGVLVPAGVPPGNYRLLLGLYDLSDPAGRLPIETAGGEVDVYEVGVIGVGDRG